MLLEKKLVKMLNKYHEKCGLCMTREEFVDYVLKKRLFRLNYLFHKGNLFNMVNLALSDCIEGSRKYIGYNEDRKNMKVTLEGRRFIRLFGLTEAWLGEHSKFQAVLLGSGGTIIIWLLAHFWPAIRVTLGL